MIGTICKNCNGTTNHQDGIHSNNYKCSNRFALTPICFDFKIHNTWHQITNKYHQCVKKVEKQLARHLAISSNMIQIRSIDTNQNGGKITGAMFISGHLKSNKKKKSENGGKMSNIENTQEIEKGNVKNYPIRINKLIEIVNIQFLKNKFNEQNNIYVGKYNINLNSRTMSYKNKSLSLTEKETKIITHLSNSKKSITIDNLQYEVWDHKLKLETHTVETHVYRLRKKVESKFNDKFFIISSKNGYKITN